MVKVQKQHKAGPTSSHLPQSPSPSCATVPGKVNTLSACQKWEFILLPWQFLHLALFSVSPSLFSAPLPPFAATSGTQLLIYLCGLCCFFPFFLFFNLFKGPLPCLVGSFSPSDEVCNYISP